MVLQRLFQSRSRVSTEVTVGDLLLEQKRGGTVEARRFKRRVPII
jgi:hypothetical protein